MNPSKKMSNILTMLKELPMIFNQHGNINRIEPKELCPSDVDLMFRSEHSKSKSHQTKAYTNYNEHP